MSLVDEVPLLIVGLKIEVFLMATMTDVVVTAGKCSQQVELSGENINITYKPDGSHIAVGNRVSSDAFVSCFAIYVALCIGYNISYLNFCSADVVREVFLLLAVEWIRYFLQDSESTCNETS